MKFKKLFYTALATAFVTGMLFTQSCSNGDDTLSPEEVAQLQAQYDSIMTVYNSLKTEFNDIQSNNNQQAEEIRKKDSVINNQASRIRRVLNNAANSNPQAEDIRKKDSTINALATQLRKANNTAASNTKQAEEIRKKDSIINALTAQLRKANTTTTTTNNKQAEEIRKKDSTINALTAQLRKANTTTTTTNNKQAEEIRKKDSIINVQAAQLRKALADAAAAANNKNNSSAAPVSGTKIKKQMADLQEQCNDFKAELEALKAENQRLKEENEKAKEELASANESINRLNTDNADLNQKLVAARTLLLSDIAATPEKKKCGGKFKATSKATSMERVNISGKILPNNVVDPGTKTFYARITKGSKLITNLGDQPKTFDYGGVDMLYTLSQDIEFYGQGRSFSMLWRRTERTNLETGVYNVTIYCDGNEVGKTRFTLQ